MGAYSQSPFRESLTGGVTNYVLSKAELPVLMSH
jgi:nucleotide-binding universal stress UspA family protein